MKSLRHMASRFQAPSFTREQAEEMERRSEEWRRMERASLIAERRNRSGIPSEFAKADIRECPQGAWEWLRNATDSPGLLLRGKVGRGKTYTACAILNRAMVAHGVRFTSFGDILRECRATFSGQGTEREIVERYTGVPLLAIDDFGKERMTEWALPIVFAVIDKRHSSGRRTIITTQYAELSSRLVVDGNADTAKAIASRMATYDVIEFIGPDRRVA